MAVKTVYEWKIELFNVAGDPLCFEADNEIVDSHHVDTFTALKTAIYPPVNVASVTECYAAWRVCLVRDTICDDEGLLDRWHAYPDKGGYLSTYRDEPRLHVPKRFKALCVPLDRIYLIQ